MKGALRLVLILLLTTGFLAKSSAQQWSTGIKIGAINHHFQQPLKRANTPSSTTTLNYSIYLDRSWGKSEKFLTGFSLDYYRNTLPPQNRIMESVHDINNYYTLNINGSFLILNLKKQNWKHYVGPTISYSLIYMKLNYPAGYLPEYMINPDNPSHLFWAGVDYTGKIGINNRLSAVYNLGALAGMESYDQFRFRGNIGIGYSF